MVSKQVIQQILDFVQCVFTIYLRLTMAPSFRQNMILTGYKLNVDLFSVLCTYL